MWGRVPGLWIYYSTAIIVILLYFCDELFRPTYIQILCTKPARSTLPLCLQLLTYFVHNVQVYLWPTSCLAPNTCLLSQLNLKLNKILHGHHKNTFNSKSLTVTSLLLLKTASFQQHNTQHTQSGALLSMHDLHNMTCCHNTKLLWGNQSVNVFNNVILARNSAAP